MKLLGSFPNYESYVIAWVEDLLGDTVHVYSEIPGDFDLEHLPAVLVEQPPGGGGFTTQEYEDAATVDIAVFDATRAAVWGHVQRIKTALPDLPGWGDVAIDEIRVSQRFGILEYGNPGMRRAVGSIDLVARSQ